MLIARRSSQRNIRTDRNENTVEIVRNIRSGIAELKPDVNYYASRDGGYPRKIREISRGQKQRFFLIEGTIIERFHYEMKLPVTASNPEM